MNKSTKGLSLPVFLEFVEMKTKVASVFPMTLGFYGACIAIKLSIGSILSSSLLQSLALTCVQLPSTIAWTTTRPRMKPIVRKVM